jgi:membrane-associated protease RseP (regulator of RpoE activity)
MNQFKEKKMKESKGKSYVALGSVGVILISFFAGNLAARFGLFIGPNASEYSKAVKYAQDYSNYTGLFEARQTLIDNYNGDVEDDVLLDGAIKGMTASLKDPYTVYMTKDEYKKFNLSNSGVRVGIGVSILAKDNTVVIVDVEADKPAAKAKLAAGDVIVKVDGEDIGGDSSKAISLISNANTNTTKLTILRNGDNTFEVELTKEEIINKAIAEDGFFLNTDGIPTDLDGTFMAAYLTHIGFTVTRHFDTGTHGRIETKEGLNFSTNGYCYMYEMLTNTEKLQDIAGRIGYDNLTELFWGMFIDLSEERQKHYVERAKEIETALDMLKNEK